MSTNPLAGRLPALALLAALALPAAAQTAGDPVEALAGALALTDDQADLVAEVYAPGDPASVWTLAAELVPTLDVDQRAALFARPERPERSAGMRERRGGRGGMARERGQRQRPERDPAQAAVHRAARDAALGLDRAGSEQLDAALERLDRREAFRSLREGTVPAPVADVLTAEQTELYRAQIALRGHLLRAARGGRRGL